LTTPLQTWLVGAYSLRESPRFLQPTGHIQGWQISFRRIRNSIVNKICTFLTKLIWWRRWCHTTEQL